MPTYDLYLETTADGYITGHVLSEPGCHAGGTSREAVEAQLQALLAADGASVTFRLQESLTGIRPMFAPEREAISATELAALLAQMEANRSTLLAANPAIAIARRSADARRSTAIFRSDEMALRSRKISASCIAK